MRLIDHALFATLFIFLTSATLSAAEDNRIIERAAKLGIVKCLPAIKYLSNFIVEDGTGSGFNATWSIESPDKSIFNVSIERSYPDGALYADVSFAHTVKGECTALMSKTFYMNKSCLAVSKDKLFEKAKYQREVNKEIAYFKDENQDVYFMPAGSGCIIITKEIFLDANKLAEIATPPVKQ